MKLHFPLVLLCSALLFSAPGVFAQNGATPKTALPAVASPVETLKVQWLDAKRDRPVPATLHFPQNGAGPFPLLIISHGLGGNRDGLDYLGNFWAAHGYVCAQIQHIDSDESLWRTSTQPLQAIAAAANPDAINNRPLDVKFAIDEMLKIGADAKSPLFGRIDASEIGVAGHSVGAFTSQAAAGRGATLKPEWRDSRVDACIAMSAPSGTLEATRDQYTDFKIPFFFLTGTNDDIPFAKPPTSPATRRAAFEAITGVDGYYLLLNGADHMSFSGQRLFGDAPADALDHDLVRDSTLLFFDAYLKGSVAAKKQLRDGGFARELGAHGTLEVK